MVGAVSVTAAVTLGSTGCLFPNACPTIGYLSSVDIVLSGPDAASAALVVLCSDVGCSIPVAESGTPPASGPLWTATDEGDGHWRIDLGMNAPERVTIEVLDADGARLTETAEELEWRRTADTGQCPGPVATDPVTVEVG
ncbi:hypothetical protein [Agromyces sp. NPDC056965]|uniref:hypothetical protein n=1 Tax=Agromyces sp. NPDC056965 TaxID=3345983 RepID=UPI0036330A37